MVTLYFKGQLDLNYYRELNIKFSIEERKMSMKYLKICSSSFAISKMQIKTTLRFHLTPVKMGKINKTTVSKF